jgi:hypothetical protein
MCLAGIASYRRPHPAPGAQKKRTAPGRAQSSLRSGSGGRIRTYDLRVMSPFRGCLRKSWADKELRVSACAPTGYDGWGVMSSLVMSAKFGWKETQKRHSRTRSRVWSATGPSAKVHSNFRLSLDASSRQCGRHPNAIDELVGNLRTNRKHVQQSPVSVVEPPLQARTICPNYLSCPHPDSCRPEPAGQAPGVSPGCH